MKTVIIVQARMTSTRLPGKVLKTVLEKPLLEYQIERLRQVNLANEIVIATTTNDTDQPIVILCEQLGLACYRGSEDNVLSRYYETAVEHKADVIVRVTSDCPLIDPLIIDRAIDRFLHSDIDYVSNTLERTYPRGMDVEVFSFKVLEESYKKAREHSELEHVTVYIYQHSEIYKLAQITHKEDYSRQRWTVDTKEDFLLIKKMLENLYPRKINFTFQDCIDLIKMHPDWEQINANIEQKLF